MLVYNYTRIEVAHWFGNNITWWSTEYIMQIENIYNRLKCVKP